MGIELSENRDNPTETEDGIVCNRRYGCGIEDNAVESGIGLSETRDRIVCNRGYKNSPPQGFLSPTPMDCFR